MLFSDHCRSEGGAYTGRRQLHRQRCSVRCESAHKRQGRECVDVMLFVRRRLAAHLPKGALAGLEHSVPL